MKIIPKIFRNFMEDYHNVAEVYEQLGDAVHVTGLLDDKTRALIKLAISIGAPLEEVVHSHPTIRFPSMMVTLSWIDDNFKGKK